MSSVNKINMKMSLRDEAYNISLFALEDKNAKIIYKCIAVEISFKVNVFQLALISSLHIVAAQIRHCLASSMLNAQLLKPYIPTNISTIILQLHFRLQILLDIIFDFIIAAQTLLSYMIYDIKHCEFAVT